MSGLGALMSLAKGLSFVNQVLPEFKKDDPAKKKKCKTPKEVSKECSRGATSGFAKMSTTPKEDYIQLLLKAGLTKEEALKIAKLMDSIE